MNTINLALKENQLTAAIMDCAFKVHTGLGPGLLESIYERCFCHELEKRKIGFERQKTIPIRYDDIVFDSGFRLDLIIENAVIVDLKSVEKIMPVHDAQIISYLRLSGLNIGMLINFNVPLIKNGVKRFVNNFDKNNSVPPRLRGEQKFL